MKQKILFRIYILLVFILTSGVTGKIFAQTFQEARNLAFNSEHAKARQICKAILSKGFDSDVALLLGRTYAWDGKYDSTRIVLNEVLAHNPNSTEVLDAFADVEYWSGNYAKAIEYCDLALQKDSTALDFLFKKAKILHSSNRFAEAVATLEKLVQRNPTHADALKKLQEFRLDELERAFMNFFIDNRRL